MRYPEVISFAIGACGRAGIDFVVLQGRGWKDGDERCGDGGGGTDVVMVGHSAGVGGE
jgi:hypothetical protein